MERLIILFLILFSSCTSEINKEKQLDITYELQIQKNDDFNQNLLSNIELKISELKSIDEFNKIKTYDSLSKKHYNYLTSIENQIKSSGNEIFFENNSYSETGEEFITKTRKYKNEIESLSNSSNFIKRLNLVFNMDDIKTKDDIYISYLDYFFKGFPKKHSEFLISEKKRRILEFENEFIDEIIIKGVK